MLSLKGEHIYLRGLEPEDLDFLYKLENDPEIWEISGTTSPYSKHVLKLYLDNVHKDIYEVKQLRLCICNLKGTVLGLIDLFDFDPKNLRVGMGIIVSSKGDRNKGIGAEAIDILSKYTFSVLGMRQIYANVLEDNAPSIHLFSKLGFEKVGIKRDWIYSGGTFKNEILFQKIYS
ncbi:GNAT family N-acetyltransferase [Arenibacter sp. BSSL-BM3]|uniref:GNAT family N-acetyltransferase n=1 Tax=Arenibacter arenosicollis TaxID=2762274 RepID=A0ABR7QQI6_9FLAO|nr:GNAT family protein [Arenibacter arenosicollis]MBC8769433.1 GNAT family N-acetyltransferase [Arenibacter arenosicollis]